MPGLYAAGRLRSWPARSSASSTSTTSRSRRASTAGDAIVGLPAVGLHTNGYSLARALIAPEEYAQPFERRTTYGDALLAPHPSYCGRSARDPAGRRREGDGAHHRRRLARQRPAHASPESCKAVFEQSRWSVPPLMAELVRRGNLGHEERYRTLNMGIGYTLDRRRSWTPPKRSPRCRRRRSSGSYRRARPAANRAWSSTPRAVALAVNLLAPLGTRYRPEALRRGVETGAELGYRLERVDVPDERLCAWIDWQFAPELVVERSARRLGVVCVAARRRDRRLRRLRCDRPLVSLVASVSRACRRRHLRPVRRRAKRIAARGSAQVLAGRRAVRSRRTAIAGRSFRRSAASGSSRRTRSAADAHVADSYDYALRPARAVILASGDGSNAQAVIDDVQSGDSALDLVGVVTNRAGAHVRERRARGRHSARGDRLGPGDGIARRLRPATYGSRRAVRARFGLAARLDALAAGGVSGAVSGNARHRIRRSCRSIRRPTPS